MSGISKLSFESLDKKHIQQVPSHGDLAIDYLRFTIDYCFVSFVSSAAVLGTPYGEQRAPFHGDF